MLLFWHFFNGNALILTKNWGTKFRTTSNNKICRGEYVVLEKDEFEFANLLMWSPASLYWLVLLNKNRHIGQNHDFSLSLVTYCGFFLLHMILSLVDLNALVYADMKIVWFLPIWKFFNFFVFWTKRSHSEPECIV